MTFFFLIMSLYFPHPFVSCRYIIEYVETQRKSGRLENAIGWYHSHPGYGCWLSGIDVSTQMLQQQFSEPWLAVVIDPTQTSLSGHVEIGAFRTLTEAEAAQNKISQTHQNIPMGKVEDFGVHAHKYYQLEMSYFKSSLDTHLFSLLWNSYWAQTLGSQPLAASEQYNAQRVIDIAAKAAKLPKANLLSAAGGGGGGGGGGRNAQFMDEGGAGSGGGGADSGAGNTTSSGAGNAAAVAAAAAEAILTGINSQKDRPPSKLDLLVRDSSKVATDHLGAVITELITAQVFQ